MLLIGLCLIFALIPSYNLFPDPNAGSYNLSSKDARNPKQFVTSADGDQSAESITSFSETSSDDVLLYQDADPHDSYANGDHAYGDDCKDLTRWQNGYTGGTFDTHEIVSSDQLHLYENHTGVTRTHSLTPAITTTYFDYTYYFQYLRFKWSGDLTNGVDNFRIAIKETGGATIGDYNFLSKAKDTWHEVNTSSFAWADSNSDVTEFYIDYSANAGDEGELWLDYYRIDTAQGVDEDLGIYTESFAGVTDWSGNSLEAEDSFSSDGDTLNFEKDHASGTTDWDHIYSNVPSLSNIANRSYVEIRHKNNATGFGLEYLRLYTGDTFGGDYQTYSLTKTTSWHTEKFLIEEIGSVECVNLFLYTTDVYPASTNWQVDYIRIGASDSMGWQHDGSTTAPIQGVDDTNFNYYFDSDGDILNLTIEDDTGSSLNGDVLIPWDYSDTDHGEESDLYQFFEIRYKAPSVGGLFWLYVQMDNKQVLMTLTEDDNFHTDRVNIHAGSYTSVSRLYLRHYNGEIGKVYIDYMQLYSIANYTVVCDGSIETDEYLYVDSNADVVCDVGSQSDGSYWISLNLDPSLEFSTSTYNVWNITTNGDAFGTGANAIGFRVYVSSWVYEELYTDGHHDTRGSFTETGTLTDLQFAFYEGDGMILSAISFFTDATDPVIVDIWENPPDPYDDESVTFSVQITEAVYVYSLILNAITYPSGFTDQDYEASEVESLVLYQYTFSTMIAGYYFFEITVDDGQGTDVTYWPITVRESEILISPITFFGAGDDFTRMQISFEINKDSNYLIREASSVDPEAQTHTGSVTAGWSNIAWEKLDTTASLVNFSIKFTSGSLTPAWVNGSYSVAQNTYYVIATDNGMAHVDSVTVSGYLTKVTSTYTIYIDDVQDSTGSISTIDFGLNFNKAGSEGASHDFAIKFVYGSSTCWYNSTYYRWEYSPDTQERGDASYEAVRAAERVSTWTLIGVIAIAAFLVTQDRKELNV